MVCIIRSDVIGGRILGTYVIAQTLAGNSLYASTTFNAANLASLSQDMQAYLGGGGSSPYAAPCANVVACVTHGVIPTAATYTQAAQNYTYYLTYDLPSVGDTTLAPVVPADAHVADRHAVSLPERGAAQRRPRHHRIAFGRAARQRHRLGAAQSLRRRRRLRRLSQQRHGEHERRARRPERLRYLEQQHLRPRRPDPAGLRNPDPGGQQQLYRRHQRARRHAGRHRQCCSALWRSRPAPPSFSAVTGTFTGDVQQRRQFQQQWRRHRGLHQFRFALRQRQSSVRSALLPGSTIAPGNSVGTIQVVGNLTVAAGTSYQVQVEGQWRRPDPGRRDGDAVRRHGRRQPHRLQPGAGSPLPDRHRDRRCHRHVRDRDRRQSALHPTVAELRLRTTCSSR